jgi:hypothetical protein
MRFLAGPFFPPVTLGPGQRGPTEAQSCKPLRAISRVAGVLIQTQCTIATMLIPCLPAPCQQLTNTRRPPHRLSRTSSHATRYHDAAVGEHIPAVLPLVVGHFAPPDRARDRDRAKDLATAQDPARDLDTDLAPAQATARDPAPDRATDPAPDRATAQDPARDLDTDPARDPARAQAVSYPHLSSAAVISPAWGFRVPTAPHQSMRLCQSRHGRPGTVRAHQNPHPPSTS